MLAAEAPDKSFQRQLKPSSAVEPGAMYSIPGPINIAAPDTLKTEQDIAMNLGADLLQFIGKPNRRFVGQARDRSGRPLDLGPVIRRYKLHFMSGFDHATREAFQVRLRATSPRITAPDKDNAESFRHATRVRLVTSICARRS